MKKQSANTAAFGIGGIVIIVAMSLASRLMRVVPAGIVAIPLAFALGGLTAGTLLRQGQRVARGLALGFGIPGIAWMLVAAQRMEHSGSEAAASLVVVPTLVFAAAWAVGGAIAGVAAGLERRALLRQLLALTVGGAVGGAILGLTASGMFGPAGLFVTLGHALALAVPGIVGGIILDMSARSDGTCS